MSIAEIHHPKNISEITFSNHFLLNSAIRDSLARLPEGSTDREKNRIKNGLTRRLGPFLDESFEIASQLDSKPYADHIKDITKLLDVKIGFISCPDGRISAIAQFDPGFARGHRRLQGLFDTRPSTSRTDEQVLTEWEIKAAIETYIVSRKIGQEVPEIVEFYGPHIFSSRPRHGCGAATEKLLKVPNTLISAMDYGAIYEYFEELGDNYRAFENVARNAGGKLTAIDTTHDAASQGLIFGLKLRYDEYGENMFDKSKSLRDNLEDMHNNKQILMTELLANELEESIREEARSRFIFNDINIENTKLLATNLINIGQIAKTLTEKHKATNFDFIPNGIKGGLSEKALNTLAYTAIRNCVFRVLTGYGDKLQDHKEQFVSIGTPMPGPFNVNNQSLSQANYDHSGIPTLLKVARGVAPSLGINPEEEATVMLVTAEFDPEENIDTEIRMKNRILKQSFVESQAAEIRAKYAEEIKYGKLVVIGTLCNPKEKRITHISNSALVK